MTLKIKLVRELLKIRYPHYNGAVRRALRPYIQDALADKTEADELLAAFRRQFSAEASAIIIGAKNETLDPLTDDTLGDLSEESDQAILTYLRQDEEFSSQIRAKSVDQIKIDYKEEITRKRRIRKESKVAAWLTRDQDSTFNDFDAQADFSLWCRKPVWTANEAAALTLSKNPKKVNEVTMKNYDSSRTSPLCRGFFELLGRIRRARSSGEFDRFIDTEKYVRWATKVGISLPGEMLTELKAENLPGDTDEHQNRVHKLYLLAIAMAVKHYRYNIKTDKFDYGYKKRMIGDLVSVHIPIDEDTVTEILIKARTWMEAKEHPALRSLQRGG